MGFDLLILFRDWRKRVIHNVSSYRCNEDYVTIEYIGSELRTFIPMDALCYIGPPEPWDSGRSC